MESLKSQIRCPHCGEAINLNIRVANVRLELRVETPRVELLDTKPSLVDVNGLPKFTPRKLP